MFRGYWWAWFIAGAAAWYLWSHHGAPRTGLPS